jgi:Ca2+-binding RTX toxin-like protein
MAKFKLEASIGQLNWSPASIGVPTIDSASKARIELSDIDGDRIVYSGRNLTLDNDLPTGGTVETAQVFSADGTLLVTVSNADVKFATLPLSDIQRSFDRLSAADDVVRGSSGDDTILFGTGRGNDTIRGLGGNDIVFASPGSNRIDGGSGDRDILSYVIDGNGTGLSGIDVDLDAGRATNPWGKTDTIKAIEEVRGTLWNDRISGSAANEFFLGLEGDDRLTGGRGKDEFSFFTGNGRDRITDFGTGADTVLLGGFEGIEGFADVETRLQTKGSHVVLDLGGGDVLIFRDTDREDLHASDFVFLL